MCVGMCGPEYALPGSNQEGAEGESAFLLQAVRRTVYSLFGGGGGAGGTPALLTVVKNTPHPEKVAKGGEDAWFINIPDNSFAVADGVGGYDQYGVDSGLYSKQFMQLAMTKDLEQVRGS